MRGVRERVGRERGERIDERESWALEVEREWCVRG